MSNALASHPDMASSIVSGISHLVQGILAAADGRWRDAGVHASCVAARVVQRVADPTGTFSVAADAVCAAADVITDASDVAGTVPAPTRPPALGHSGPARIPEAAGVTSRGRGVLLYNARAAREYCRVAPRPFVVTIPPLYAPPALTDAIVGAALAFLDTVGLTTGRHCALDLSDWAPMDVAHSAPSLRGRILVVTRDDTHGTSSRGLSYAEARRITGGPIWVLES